MRALRLGPWLAITALATLATSPAWAIIKSQGNPTLITGLTTLNGVTPSFGALQSAMGPTSAAGSLYADGDTVTLTGGTATTQAVLAIVDIDAVSATVAAGGTGGTNGACTVTATTGTGTKAQFTGTVSGNALTGPLTVAVAGDYTINPTGISSGVVPNEPVTGCSLTGAQVAMTMGALGFSVQNPGVYSVVPASPVAQGSSSGSGTGATFPMTWGWLAAGGSFADLTIAGISAQSSNTIWGLRAGNQLAPGTSGGATGTEETFFGYQAGYAVKQGGFNTAFGVNAIGSGGSCAPNVSSLTAVGTDAMRNYCGGNGSTAIGTSALKNFSQNSFFGANNTAIGTSTMLNLNSSSGVNNVALGENACQGASGSQSFNNGVCVGQGTGGALTSASKFLVLGTGIGNSTLASASGVILIGSGNVAVDTNTSNSINIENIITATGTGTAATSITTIAGGMAHNGTALPAQAAGTLGISGNASNPTTSANGEGDIFLVSTTGGVGIQGKGSTSDFTVFDSAGAAALTVPTGTTGIKVAGSITATLSAASGTNQVCTGSAGTAFTTVASGTACASSAMRYKNPFGERLDPSRLAALDPDAWRYKDEERFGDRVHVGLYADDVQKMDPRCVVYQDGKLENYEDRCVIAYLVAATQAQQREIEGMRRYMGTGR